MTFDAWLTIFNALFLNKKCWWFKEPELGKKVVSRHRSWHQQSSCTAESCGFQRRLWSSYCLDQCIQLRYSLQVSVVSNNSKQATYVKQCWIQTTVNLYDSSKRHLSIILDLFQASVIQMPSILLNTDRDITEIKEYCRWTHLSQQTLRSSIPIVLVSKDPVTPIGKRQHQSHLLHGMKKKNWNILETFSFLDIPEQISYWIAWL